jgi:hypothetical protein
MFLRQGAPRGPSAVAHAVPNDIRLGADVLVSGRMNSEVLS